MVEPFSLTAVGVLVLSDGVKFLYAQATELLKYRRERKEARLAADAAPKLQPPAHLLEGAVEPAAPDDARLAQLEDTMRERRLALAEYADGVADVDPADLELQRRVDDLRRVLEAVYGQRITFKGELRPPSGPLVENEVRAVEAEIHASDVGVVDGAAGGAKVVQRTDVTHAKIDAGSRVGVVRLGPSEESEEKTI
jgi:hypothetical protein